MVDAQTAVRELADYGQKIAARNLVIATGGNTSLRTDEAIYIKASGVAFADGDPNGYIALDPGSGEPRDPSRKPSVERPIHLACYRARDDVRAVVHCHPSMAIAWGATGESLGAFTPDTAAYLGHVVPLIPYAPPSSELNARRVGEAIAAGAHAVILANHGAVTVGRTLKEAFTRTCLLEEAAKMAVFSRLLNPQFQFFTPEQVQEVQKRAYKHLGVRG